MRDDDEVKLEVREVMVMKKAARTALDPFIHPSIRDGATFYHPLGSVRVL